MFEAARPSNSAMLPSADFAGGLPAPIDFPKIWSILWRGRATIALITATALVLAIVFIAVAPRKYTAVTELLIEPADLRAVVNDATPASPPSDTALIRVDSQVRVLTSDDVLRPVVAEEGLAHDPEFVGSPSLLRIFVDDILSHLGRGSSLVAADPALAALNALRRHVKVQHAERTYVIDVAVDSAVPAKAARLANAIARSYLAEQTQVRSDAARQISQSLSARLNDLKERVHAAEEKVQAFRVSHNIVDANGQLVIEQQLADLNNQLATARAQAAAAKARLDQIEAVQKSNIDVGGFPAAVLSPTVGALRAQYAQVMRVEAQQMSNLGPLHPAVIETRAQAERLKRMIADEVNRIALAARTEYESAKASEDMIVRNVDALTQSTLATDAALVTLRELQREAQASRTVYEAFLVRARETGAQERLDTKNIQVLSRADLPLTRSFPPSNLLLALGTALFGIAAGSGLVLLREGSFEAAPPSSKDPDREPLRLDTPPSSIAAHDIPVLAVVPAVDGEQAGDANSRFALGIRRVYEAVRARHDKDAKPSILIVAADERDDTAAVALTLAAVAATDRRVLLIDADIERRTLSAINADRGDVGLVDVAVGRFRLSEAVVRDRDTNVNLLPFVSPSSRRDRAITDEDIRRAFAQTRLFDVVIVATTDLDRDPSASFFAGLVDHIVLVVRADKPDTRSVDHSVLRLGSNAGKVLGAVLTGAAAA
jgi:polysaccharide biosynthesis transport protein